MASEVIARTFIALQAFTGSAIKVHLETYTAPQAFMAGENEVLMGSGWRESKANRMAISNPNITVPFPAPATSGPRLREDAPRYLAVLQERAAIMFR